LLVEGLGADVNKEEVIDGYSATPMTLAVLKGNVAMVRVLNGLGADVNRFKQDGRTPLQFAVNNGDVAVARCLVKDLGADINRPDHNGVTPLLLAAETRDVAMACCMVKELGANVNQDDLTGEFPLFVSALRGHLDLARVLVEELGAGIYLTGLKGTTALMAAAHCKRDKVIRWLTKHGANSQTSAQLGTAAGVSRITGAPAEQTAYLEAKAHCSNPGCGGVGLRNCQGCKQVRYCGVVCGLAHWPVHKTECKRIDKA
jgi:ankyrin repeat protein